MVSLFVIVMLITSILSMTPMSLAASKEEEGVAVDIPAKPGETFTDSEDIEWRVLVPDDGNGNALIITEYVHNRGIQYNTTNTWTVFENSNLRNHPTSGMNAWYTNHVGADIKAIALNYAYPAGGNGVEWNTLHPSGTFVGSWTWADSINDVNARTVAGATSTIGSGQPFALSISEVNEYSSAARENALNRLTPYVNDMAFPAGWWLRSAAEDSFPATMVHPFIIPPVSGPTHIMNADNSVLGGFRAALWVRVAPMEYTLSFDVNGGHSSTKPADQVLEVGELAAQPTRPTKDGYEFTGWNTAQDGSGTTWDFATTTMPSNDVTLYAQWTVVTPITTYTLSFDVNGGDVDKQPKDQVLEAGELATAPATPTRKGYTFTGWNTVQNGSGTTWHFTTMTMPSHDITLYAQWRKDTPTGTDNGNNKENNKESNGDSNSGKKGNTIKPNPEVSGSKPVAPSTGDHNAFALYVALLLISLGIVVISSRRNNLLSRSGKAEL